MADSPAAKSTPVLSAKTCHFVVVEDDALLCDLLTHTLRQHFAPAALHAFRNGSDAVKHCARERVDLLFTDLGLPDINGREVIRRARAREPQPRTIVLTGNIDGTLPAELVALGVAGFVDKGAPLEHAVRAVERVLAGGMYFFAGVMPTASRIAMRDSARGPGVAALSARERDVVRGVAAGLSSKEIAQRLHLSARTVENYRAHAMQKIGVRDTAGLVRWCLERGLG